MPLSSSWRSSVFYQIYPASFCSTTGSSTGDLDGVSAKLPLLKSLGVDYVWLSPVYESPWKDSGYDISDYRKVRKEFGGMEAWERLVRAVHREGMKIIMDLVVNHTSDQHKWFLKSRSSRKNPKRDWYYWRPARITSDGKRFPPNNWMSVFRGGSAWQWDERTQQYYLHLFSKAQPDLNWENPEVRGEVYEIMRFWLDKGVDGFRMDVINCLSKQPGLPDAPTVERNSFLQPPDVWVANGPKMHHILKRMQEKVLSHYEAVTIGECPFTDDPDMLLSYVLPKSHELNMVFTFALNDIDQGVKGPMSLKSWTLSELKWILAKEQWNIHERGGWNALAIESHDQPRSVTRFTDETPEYRERSAKLLAMLHVCQSGSVFIYQGQEFGQINMPNDWPITEYKDVRTKMDWDEAEKAGEDMDEFMRVVQAKARDHARTPMQWDSTRNAGFTTGAPWMRVHDDFRVWNVERQMRDPQSVWSFWQRALRMRKAQRVLIYGDFVLLRKDDENVFAFTRSLAGEHSVLVALNFSPQPQTVQVGRVLRNLFGDGIVVGDLLIGNFAGGVEASTWAGDAVAIELSAWEGGVWELVRDQ